MSNEFTVRIAEVEDAAAIAKVHVDSWRTSYRGIVADEFLEKLSYERRETMWKNELSNPDQPSVIIVTERPADGVVGFSSAGPIRGEHKAFDGELYAIYLLAHAQGCGLGKALFVEAAHWLLDHSYTSMLLWALKDNPARGFYEAMGGVVIASESFTLGNQELIEVAYGWRDIHQLLNRHPRAP